MADDAPIIGKSLRVASFSITLSAIVILGTIGYSIFEEFNYLFSGPSDLFKFKQEERNGNMEIVLDLTIPNKGMYPLELSIDVSVTARGEELAEGSSGTLVIPPGSVERILLELDVHRDDLLELMPIEEGDVGLNVTLRAGFQPFAFITVSAGQSFVENVQRLDLDKGQVSGDAQIHHDPRKR